MITPRYLVIEGMDGAGKSTLAKRLTAALRANCGKARLFAFPGSEAPVGGMIRDVFAGRAKIRPRAMLWLFVAEAVDMESDIAMTLDEQQAWVVCDRHTLASTQIYQRPIHGESRVEAVVRAADLRIPDRVYLLDVSPEVALTRRLDRDGEDHNAAYESTDLKVLGHQRQMYRALLDQFEGARLLDGTKSPENLLVEIWRDLSLPGTP